MVPLMQIGIEGNVYSIIVKKNEFQLLNNAHNILETFGMNPEQCAGRCIAIEYALRNEEIGKTERSLISLLM